MKILLIILQALLCNLVMATNYYISPTGGSGAGTTSATAWNTAKYNISYGIIASGDTVFWQAGGTYLTDFPISNNIGTQAKPIVHTRYGTGAKPIISGLTTMTNWVAEGTIPGLYYTTLDVLRLNIVLINGVMKAMARYPKNSFLPVTAFSGRTSVTADLSGMNFNPVGAEVVAKKSRYILDRHPITAVSGNTLTITGDNSWGDATVYEFIVGNGIFIQNAIGATTQFGEWTYDNPNNRLYVNFGASAPSNNVVQASTIADLAQVNGRSYITFDNLDLRGANENLVSAQYADHIVVRNCEMSFADVGFSGLQGTATHTTTGNNISNTLTGGISTYETSNHLIENNVVTKTHMLEGMGKSGDLVGSGICVTGNDIIIRNNFVDSSGYCGIAFYGSDINNIGKSGNGVLVENNFVSHFCLRKDDGGGIYTFGNTDQTFRLRIIRNNIILDGVGYIGGALAYTSMPYSVGLYLDNYSSNVRAENNTISRVTGAGVFFNSTNRDTLISNTVFDCGVTGFLMLHLPGQIVNGLYVANNKFIAKSVERLLDFEYYVPLSNFNGIGTFVNNVFQRPFGTNSFLTMDDRNSGSPIVTDRTISQFQATFGYAVGSISSTPITSVNDFKLQYNYSPNTTTSSLSGVYRNAVGTPFTGNISQPAYSGDLLYYQSPLPPDILPVGERGFITIKGVKLMIVPTPQIP